MELLLGLWIVGVSSGIVELVLGLCSLFRGCGVSSGTVELVLGLWDCVLKPWG